jgi:Glycosyl hydrolase family 63 C-terminal domain
MYTELRQNVVSTVYESWKSTGFAWEQYNPDNGAGQRTQHFTGWTSLVVKIMALPDLDKITEPHYLYMSDKKSIKDLFLSFPFLLLIGILALMHINRNRFLRLALWTQRHFQQVIS